MNWLDFKNLCLKCALKPTVMRAVLYREGFPKPRSITGTAKGRRWREDEIDSWINSQPVSDG